MCNSYGLELLDLPEKNDMKAISLSCTQAAFENVVPVIEDLLVNIPLKGEYKHAYLAPTNYTAGHQRIIKERI